MRPFYNEMSPYNQLNFLSDHFKVISYHFKTIENINLSKISVWFLAFRLAFWFAFGF